MLELIVEFEDDGVEGHSVKQSGPVNVSATGVHLSLMEAASMIAEIVSTDP